MSETSNVIVRRQVEAEVESHFRSLRAFREPEPLASPEPAPPVRWSARDVRLFVATFAMMAVALGIGLLLGMF